MFIVVYVVVQEYLRLLLICATLVQWKGMSEECVGADHHNQKNPSIINYHSLILRFSSPAKKPSGRA